MASSEKLRRVALVGTDVSEEFSASFIRVTKFGELGTTLAVTSNRRRVIYIHEYAILNSHRRENLKSYITNMNFADNCRPVSLFLK
jgi:hypothetical protein